MKQAFTCCRFSLAEWFCAHPHMPLAPMELCYSRGNWTANPFFFPEVSSSVGSCAELLQVRGLTHKNGKGSWGWEQLSLEIPGTWCRLSESCSLVPGFSAMCRANMGGKDEGEHPCLHCRKAEMQGTWCVLGGTGSQSSMQLNWEGRRCVMN